MASLPTNFALWFSRDKCVGVPKNDPSSFLKVDAPKISDPLAKFVAEPAGDDSVNIKSSYNEKYWVASKQEGGKLWVAASADKPQNDQTKDACTLFKAVVFGSSTSGTPIVKLTYVSNNKGVEVVNDGQLVLTDKQVAFSEFQAFDLDKVVTLPDKGLFRSEQLNNNYLCAWVKNEHNYHRFEPGMNPNNPLLVHEFFPTDVLNYRIKNNHFGKFWRATPNWIWADIEEEPDYSKLECVFSFEKLDEKEHVYAVRNLGNNNYCGGHSEGGNENCLSAYYPTKGEDIRLIFEEYKPTYAATPSSGTGAD